VRIARRRSVALPSRVGTLLAIGLAGGAVVAIAITLVLRLTPDESAAVAAPSAQLHMSDAVGLAGLPSLAAPLDAGRSALAGNQIVAYYGSPRTPGMGILGQHEPEQVARLLLERARLFDELNGETGVLPVLHIVSAVAQPQPNADGTFIRYVDDRTIRRFIDLGRREGFATILDLQIGGGQPLAEVEKIAPYLLEPDVFVALDPEFALRGPYKPGEAVGSIDAADINAVQHYLAEFSRTNGLPPKVLVVHQFQAEMITNPDAIERVAGVDLVIDMDGYGPADIKAVKYQRFGGAPYAPHGGIKLFLEHEFDLLSEAAILALQPPPAFIVYR
jgi:hypothetical protein